MCFLHLHILSRGGDTGTMLVFCQEMEKGVDIGLTTNSTYSTTFSKEIYLEAHK